MKEREKLPESKRNVSRIYQLPDKSRFQLSDSMGDAVIKKIALIWRNMQKQSTAINGVYTIDYSVKGKDCKQSFLDAENLIVAVILRINQNGEAEFALTKKENLTMLDDNCRLNSTWEALTFEVRNLDKPEEELKQQLEQSGFILTNSRMLDSGKTSIAPSFSNQMANFMLLEVQKHDKTKMDDFEWININYLDYFLNMQERKEEYVSSECTIYAFLSFLKKCGKNIEYNYSSGPNPLLQNLNHPLEQDKLVKQSDIYSKSPRFQVVEVKTKEGKKDVIAQSKNSIGAICYKIENGKVMVGLQKQVRSPFLTNEKYQGVITEMIGGICEGEGNSLDDVIRETREESGYLITEEDCKPILGGKSSVTVDASEFTELYKVNVTGKKRGNLNLDELGEFIENKIQWLELEEAIQDIQDLSAPIGTKLALLLLDRQLTKERERGIEEEITK